MGGAVLVRVTLKVLRGTLTAGDGDGDDDDGAGDDCRSFSCSSCLASCAICRTYCVALTHMTGLRRLTSETLVLKRRPCIWPPPAITATA